MPMKEIVATVTSKGQVTIPIEVRKHLQVSDHSKLAFIIDDEGSVRIRPATFPDIESLRGAAGTLEHPLSWHDMREIARDDYITRKFGKSDE